MKFYTPGRAAVLALVGLCAFAPATAEESRIGFGFQSMVAGSPLNAASLRGWTPGDLGWEVNALYGNVKISQPNRADSKADATGVELKGLCTLIKRANSQMYVGAKFAYIDCNTKNLPGKGKFNATVYQPGVLVGSDFCIPQLPEVRFNFEVGYAYADTDTNRDVDLKLHGINVGLGIHYNF